MINRKKPRISAKKIEKLARQGRLRDGFEIWVDKHNHKMELVRTFTSVMGLIVSSIVMLKVFGLIR
jgi:hypothetical protein